MSEGPTITQATFLQAIIDSPEDDGARLAYAAWLDERGDPRGEFIRAQCELAKRLQADVTQMEKDYPQRKALKRRAEQLVGAHGEEWNRPMRQSGCEQWEYQQGFVDTIVIPGVAFLQFAPVLFQTGPIKRVRLTRAVPDVAALAAVQQLTRVSELSLHKCGIGNAGARALAASPYLRNVTVLDLSYNDIGDSGAQALASSPNLSRLTALHLYRPTRIFDPTRQDIIQDLGACALASSRYLARLTELGLSGNLIGRAGWEALRSRFGQVQEPVSCGPRANNPLHLTGAAIKVSRGS
jgi:uncharacterized protein (TIGR02996 family)